MLMVFICPFKLHFVFLPVKSSIFEKFKHWIHLKALKTVPKLSVLENTFYSPLLPNPPPRSSCVSWWISRLLACFSGQFSVISNSCSWWSHKVPFFESKDATSSWILVGHALPAPSLTGKVFHEIICKYSSSGEQVREWMDEWAGRWVTDGRMDGQRSGWVDEGIGGWIGGWVGRWDGKWVGG